ncbi:MAG: phasin family protein [Rubrivivax sp.]|jgi:poly(hydroxyalkanoate) granule-associated protein|nr:phasin family protein [Rubrivivax sp.]
MASMAQGLIEGQLPQAVKDSAQQIWLAGMGAFAKIPAEGAKVFEALVSEGMKLQKKTQGMAEEKISEVTGKMSAMAGTVTAKAGQNWDKLEEIFEARTAKALNKLGVPTAKDVDALIKRVDALAAAVAKLNKGGVAKAAAAEKAAPAKATRSVKTAKAAVKAAVQAPVVRRARAAKAAAAETAATVAKASKRVSRRAAKVVDAVTEAASA